MESNWAAEHLQVIRTLMERSALYRRALAPIMSFNGVLGTAAALLGWGWKIDSPRPFLLYCCAFHAAGFFMPRGMRLFGWAFVLGGCALLALGLPDWLGRLYYAHGIMGFFFGVLHLAYGVYLYFTEKPRNET